MDKEKVIMLLKSQRDEMDQLLVDVGGTDFRKELFSADSINGYIQDSFREIVTQLEKHETKRALEYAKEWSKTQWLETTEEIRQG